MVWRDEAPEGKLDLLLSLDFRMTSTTLFSDVVLPAATWYEKHDLSTTDMHPFVHAFTPAIAPPWQTRTDFDAFHGIARAFSGLAGPHLGVRKDLVAVPLLHDTPDALATPGGVVRDWKTGECDRGAGPDDAEARRGGARLRRGRRRRWPRSARCWTGSAPPPRASPSTSTRRSSTCAGSTATVRGGVADGRPRAGHATSTPARRSWRCPAPPTAGSPPRASRPWSGAPGSGWPTWPPSTRASRSASPTPRPGRCR